MGPPGAPPGGTTVVEGDSWPKTGCDSAEEKTAQNNKSPIVYFRCIQFTQKLASSIPTQLVFA
jgi:hypothetical protein